MAFRDEILRRLREDLIGPLTPDETLTDRPTQRYSTAILYPRDAQMQPQEDEDRSLEVSAAEDGAAVSDDEAISLHAAYKPATAGLSFAVRCKQGESPHINIEVRCATYRRFAVDKDGKELDTPPLDRSQERWRRVPLHARVDLPVKSGENRIDLAAHAIEGLELYSLVTPHAGVQTITLALANYRKRGESSAYDEEQHFFQVCLEVVNVAYGELAPRPSRRAQLDEDSRVSALIYRDIKEYAVGHTCSARVILRDGVVGGLTTDWLPAVTVPRVGDAGDTAFESLQAGGQERNVLDAQWLAAASTPELVLALGDLVSAYRNWIATETTRISLIPTEFQAQAKKNISRCDKGARRMIASIECLKADPNVAMAFQLAQSAMAMQFGWSRHGAQRLVWRPFQLAFQLLVLESLSERPHPDREIMDLLWFPTGGGKTEAYLALTAFVIFLRRLRGNTSDTGGGVAVLMRYTLRLLTVQQFQRAAAMILACELLRRQRAGAKAGKNLGLEPIGIGLWVGAATTPLTLQDAFNRSPTNPSRPEQLIFCPCCHSALNWKISPRETTVECSSVGDICELASTGRRFPVWTIDEEVYRHAPSLLIGTVDKFAQVVRKMETRVLFGRATTHAAPDLIIQDELHLISGPLGSMTGLYEVAIDELCRSELVRPKIIGSTATIRRAEEQIRALFDRATYQFPAPGIDASNSGFAVTDNNVEGRLYVGLTTAGRSATFMLQALVASLLQAATASGASAEERDQYWTLVAYFNSLRELGRGLVLMQDDVPVSIGQFAARRSEKPRRVQAPAELTSRVPSYEIRDMLERLSKSAGDPEAVDLLVASNMISVGMDVPRLGLMVVNAQPKTLSEYIQATSRVGRGRAPGIVITMYNSMRARDRSHFETFETWHRSLYRDVEATSVTPFASRAQDKALHAVLVALVRHIVTGMDRRPVLDDIRRAEVEQIASLIESRAARIDPTEQAIVAQKLKRLIDQWAARPDLQTYWDDFDRRISLLMSAEQFAAKADVDADLDADGARRALWPTPNSMREVEAGAPFVLRHVLKSESS